jgi:Trp operon repressor
MADLTEATGQEITKLLRELVKWAKFETLPKLRTILEQNLPSDKEKLIYELSDGERSTRDIAKLVGVSHVTITNYWDKWSKLGIVDAAPKEGRYMRICSLEQVGLEVPELSDRNRTR